MRTTNRLFVLAVVLSLILPAIAMAQEEPPSPVVWLSMVQAKPGQSEALTRTIVEQNSALYDQLMADGAVLNWGVVQPINHTPDQNYSHIEVVVFPNWQGVDDFVNTFMSSMQAMSEEDRQAQQEAFEKVVEPGSHFDVVNRGAYIGGTAQGPPRYFSLGYFKVQRGSDLLKVYKEHRVPVLEKLSADGDIGQFGVEVQEIHGDHSWTHLAWVALPGLGAMDAIEAAFEAADAARSEDERAALQASFMEMLVPGTHRDEIVVVVHWSDGSDGGGDDDAGGNE